MLKVKALNAAYGAIPAIANINFEVHPGQALCLLGRNGMGKTTTFKALLGLVSAQAEKLCWQGIDLRTMRPENRAQLGLGYMPQEQRLFPELTVMDNLKLGGGRDAQHLETLLAHFPQLAARLEQPAGVLSGGEQQMLGITRALWGQPQLLLLDEPSEGVMPTLTISMKELLLKHCALGGMVIVAEQNVRWARSWCTHGLILSRGKCVFSGALDAMTDAHIHQHLAVLSSASAPTNLA